MGKGKNKKNKDKGFNNHHLINRIRGGTDVEENIRRTKVRLHSCLHELFGNETPAESLETLIDYYGDVFVDDFKHALYEVLHNYKGNEHKKKCYRKQIKNKGVGGFLE